MMKNVVTISDLSSPSLTRERGAEAYAQLEKLFDHQHIELSLDSADSLSTSFLDELICKLRDSDRLERITFVTSKERVRISRKLRQYAMWPCTSLQDQAAGGAAPLSSS
jgi:STAS-like domain of unknown function (DUF4325)